MIFITVKYSKSEVEGSIPEPVDVLLVYKNNKQMEERKLIEPHNGHLLIEKGTYIMKKGYNPNILQITGQYINNKVVISLPMNACQIVEIYE